MGYGGGDFGSCSGGDCVGSGGGGSDSGSCCDGGVVVAVEVPI